MAIISDHRTTEEWGLFIGMQCRALRIRAGLEQTELAARTNLSLGAIKNLENGKGSSLKTFINVLRALNRTDWLESLAPPITVSPLQMLKAGPSKQPRLRVSRPRKRPENKD